MPFLIACQGYISQAHLLQDWQQNSSSAGICMRRTVLLKRL